MKDSTIVVAMLTHRDPMQVRRVVESVLSDSRVAVVIHHDPRGPRLDLPGERVWLVPDARPATWGGMGVARAQMRVLRYAAEALPEATWFLVISGADYVAQPLYATIDELDSTSSDAFVRWFRSDLPADQDEHPWQARTRNRYLRRLKIPGSHRSLPFPRRHPFGSTTGLYVGDMWVNLNRRAVEHVLEQAELRPDLVRYFSRCSIPDEALLPTLLLNDSEHLWVAPDHRRYIRWEPGAAHPKTIEVEDVPDLLSSGAFFARKFDPNRSAAAMDLIDQSLGLTSGGWDEGP